MTLLQDLYVREEARLAQLQQKLEKASLKAIEKEFRKINVRCNVEQVRGQKTRNDHKNKYQSVTHMDSDSLSFYAKRTSKGGGGHLMLEIQKKTQQIADAKCHSM